MEELDKILNKRKIEKSLFINKIEKFLEDENIPVQENCNLGRYGVITLTVDRGNQLKKDYEKLLKSLKLYGDHENKDYYQFDGFSLKIIFPSKMEHIKDDEYRLVPQSAEITFRENILSEDWHIQYDNEIRPILDKFIKSKEKYTEQLNNDLVQLLGVGLNLKVVKARKD